MNKTDLGMVKKIVGDILKDKKIDGFSMTFGTDSRKSVTIAYEDSAEVKKSSEEEGRDFEDLISTLKEADKQRDLAIAEYNSMFENHKNAGTIGSDGWYTDKANLLQKYPKFYT